MKARNPAWIDSCTIGTATGDATRDGGPLVFSNSDDPFDTRTRLVVDSKDGCRFIATRLSRPLRKCLSSRCTLAG